ncbi:MAG: hypothetical protein ACRELB_20725, partial [Polyangiaceae bacterium]
FESESSVLSTRTHVDSRKIDVPRDDLSALMAVDVGPNGDGPDRENVTHHSVEPSGVEELLAVALERASSAGEWTVVAQLARELEARRLAAAASK